MELLIITGQSGAGKTAALNFTEDLGYYCVDNLPPEMIESLITCLSKDSNVSKVAVGIDVRGRSFFDKIGEVLEKLDALSISYKVLFLEAKDSTLLRRFQETRRIHPLSKDGDNEKAIRKESLALEDIKKQADYVIDTSDMKAAELQAEIIKFLGDKGNNRFEISIMSFGYKYGLPSDADWILDVRFLPNPFYVKSLKKLTGKNKKVKDFVLSFEETKDFISRISSLLIELSTRYQREGKYHLTIAIGCTGGQHRSVVIAEELYKNLSNNGFRINIKHRQL